MRAPEDGLPISASGRDKTPVRGPTGACLGTAMGGQQLRLGDSEHHLRARKTSVRRRWASVCLLGDTGSMSLRQVLAA